MVLSKTVKARPKCYPQLQIRKTVFKRSQVFCLPVLGFLSTEFWGHDSFYLNAWTSGTRDGLR